MSPLPGPRKTLREFIAGLSVWGRIFWVIVLGYIVGRIIWWIKSLM